MAPMREAWAGRSTSGRPPFPERKQSEPGPGVNVDELIKRVQTRVYQRRLRTRDLFCDYDKARCGRCTRQQFARAVNNLYPGLRSADVLALAERFTESSPEAHGPQNVNYQKLCEVLDAVFGVPCLERQPEAKVPRPGTLLQHAGGFRPAATSDEERVLEVLRRMALFTRTRGVDLSACYLYGQRTDAACRAGMRGTGKVTHAMFLQRFPFLLDFSERDLQLLFQRYAAEHGTVHVHALVKEVAALEEDPDLVLPEARQNNVARGEIEIEVEEDPPIQGPVRRVQRPGSAPSRRRPSSADSLRCAVSASRLHGEEDVVEAQGSSDPNQPRSPFSDAQVPKQGRPSTALGSQKERPLPPRPRSAAASTRADSGTLRPEELVREGEVARLAATTAAAAAAAVVPEPAAASPELPPRQLQQQRPLSAPATRQRPASAGAGRSATAGWPQHTPSAGIHSGAWNPAVFSRPSSAAQGTERVEGQPQGGAQEDAPRPDVLSRVRAIVAERRIRVLDGFKDADPLRRGVCTFSQLRAALTFLGLDVETKEYDSLFNIFQSEEGQFCYRDFCANVCAPEASANNAVVPKPPMLYKAELDDLTLAELGRLEAHLRGHALRRRLELRSSFANLSRGRAGHVTRSQFMRIMSALGFRLSEPQLKLLCRAYCDTQDGQLNYLDFCDSIDQPMSH